MTTVSGLGKETVEEVVAALSAHQPTPAAGSGLAVTLAVAAGLVTKCARKATGRMEGAERMVVDALESQRRALALADEDARVFAAVLAGHRSGSPHTELSSAADPPLAIAELGVEVGAAAADLAVGGKPRLRADAHAAALLAEAVTRSAATLVDVDLDDAQPEDGRRSRARWLAEAAGRLRTRAESALEGSPA